MSSLNKVMCSKPERMEPHLKCQPSKILIGVQGFQSREQNDVSTEVIGNELCFVCGRGLADWNYTAVTDQAVNIVISFTANAASSKISPGCDFKEGRLLLQRGNIAYISAIQRTLCPIPHTHIYLLSCSHYCWVRVWTIMPWFNLILFCPDFFV